MAKGTPSMASRARVYANEMAGNDSARGPARQDREREGHCIA